MNHIFDTHAHYDDERFDLDRSALLAAIQKQGVDRILNAGCDAQSNEATIRLTEEIDIMYGAVGIHPHEAQKVTADYLQVLERQSHHAKIKAIGEIGLDYYYDFSPRDQQKKVFEEQLILAKELDLPVIIHNRDAHQDTLALLKKYRPKGVVHCFSGSAEIAEEIMKLDMYIGFTGVVTFKNAKRALEAARVVHNDRIVVETDCPYMAPEPLRGQRCDSSMIQHTAAVLAQVKGMSLQDFLEMTWQNANALYHI